MLDVLTSPLFNLLAMAALVVLGVAAVVIFLVIIPRQRHAGASRVSPPMTTVSDHGSDMDDPAPVVDAGGGSNADVGDPPAMPHSSMPDPAGVIHVTLDTLPMPVVLPCPDRARPAWPGSRRLVLPGDR